MTSLHVWFELITTPLCVICFIIILVFTSDASFSLHVLFFSYNNPSQVWYSLHVIITHIIISSFCFIHLLIDIIFSLGILRSMAHGIYYTWCISYMRAWVSDHWVFEPCFISFLSPYYLSLRYVLGLKTTLRPWYHASCFDNSHVGDTWNWLESILIMIGQELWYYPIPGHSHLREFFFIEYAAILFYTSHWGTPFLVKVWIFRRPLCQGILLSVDDGFLSHGHPSEEIRRHFSHWSMRHDWYISSGVFCIGAYFSVDDGFWGIAVPWRWLDSFHIRVWDMTGCFDWMCL